MDGERDSLVHSGSPLLALLFRSVSLVHRLTHIKRYRSLQVQIHAGRDAPALSGNLLPGNNATRHRTRSLN